MPDSIEIMGRSLVQHGASNGRIYLMKLHPEDAGQLPGRLDELAVASRYGKIFAKVPDWASSGFLGAGYLMEAQIPGFYGENTAACFLAKYFDPARSQERHPRLVGNVLAAAALQNILPRQELPEGHVSRIAREEDIEEMAALFGRVFSSYPFPIHDPAFLRAAMYDATVYFGVWEGNRLVAVSSAELDHASRSAEMTDFATLPEYRGQGFALYLLQRMEEELSGSGVRSFYTIARAYSFGMNITFARNGYSFGGTLVNNTNISGNLESMNVWYKIDPEATPAA